MWRGLAACGSDDGDDIAGTSGTDPETTAGSDSSATSLSTTTTANTTSVADTGSSSDAPTTTGDDADGSTSGTTGDPPGTAGCGMPAVDASSEWIGHSIDVDGVPREYWLWLPPDYDPERAYPVVYQFHGCSDGEDRWTNNPPVEQSSGADAIHIRGKAIASCWDTNPQGPDVLFFDALVPYVEATWCADPTRRFVTGYSGGAFMTHVLGCVRADLLRGVASIAGGQPGTDCPGRVAALLIHDANDNTVNISASIAARDDHLTRNNCDASMSAPVDPDPCVAYAGCDPGLPVVWCQTAMQDHSRQDGLSGPAFWNFLAALPAE
jgi:polyhydroxybutyrate depolymerase